MFPIDFDRDSISTGTMRKTHKTMISNYGYEKVSLAQNNYFGVKSVKHRLEPGPTG